jgi:hypothetical protein
MKTIFFNYPLDTPKVAVISTNQKVSKLVADGIIPKGAGYIEKDYIDENSSREDWSMAGMPEYLKFNNVKKPSRVEWDMELVQVYILGLIRNQRGMALNMLDTLAMRALTKGLTDVVAEIEADKDILRNLPNTVDLSRATDYWTAYEAVPDAFIDFDAKYNPKLA